MQQISPAYKSRHSCSGKVIHWELYKKFQFDHTNKWYMHNRTSVMENDTHNLLCDFDIQMDHLISSRRPDLIIIHKRRGHAIVDFPVPADHRIKFLKSEKKNKFLALARELKKLWNIKVRFIPIIIGPFFYH